MGFYPRLIQKRIDFLGGRSLFHKVFGPQAFFGEGIKVRENLDGEGELVKE